MPSIIRNSLAKCGLASLSDMEGREWKELFPKLESDQASFLSMEKEFRSAEYKWQRDSLHTWSRVWEYPYVYYNLLEGIKNVTGSEMARIVDFGSGVTFFPFTIAKLGSHVTCIDCDPICESDINRAVQCTDTKPGKVDFKLSKGCVLPIENNAIDIVYSVSVLEHIPNFIDSIREISRIMKPGGRLILTIDLDLLGNSEIGISKYCELIDILDKYYDYVYKDKTVHPADMLTTKNSPCPIENAPGIEYVKYYFKNNIRRYLLGRKVVTLPSLLAIQGFVLVKR